MKLGSLALGITLLLSLLAAPAFAGESGKELFLAVQGQDAEAVKALLDKGADANHIEDGRPTLAWAAQNGNTQIVDLLLKAGAKPNVVDGIGQTPLMRAIETQQPGVILLLLKAKADPNAKTPDGRTCLSMAVESHKPKVVQALIVSGADVKHVTPDGDSVVLAAAQDGSDESFEIIRILGKAGAEMNASNAAYTALTYAIEQGNAKLVTTLLEAGANPNATTQSGRTPISAALGTTEILQLLLNAKANPNLKNGSDETPLMEAIYNDQVDAVKMLLAAGADVKTAGPNGTTALEYAQQQFRSDIIPLLTPNTPVAAAPDANANASAPAGAGAPKADSASSITACTMVDAAKMQMLLHQSLEDQVALGNMDSDIFRTFGDDTKDYADMLTNNPTDACRLFERLAVKYGVESPYAKLNAAH